MAATRRTGQQRAPLTPEQTSLRASMAAHESWALCADRARRTEPARQAAAALRRTAWEKEIDPDGVLPPTELQRRVESKRSAHFRRLALKSSLSRSKAAAARQKAAELEAAARATDRELAAAEAEAQPGDTAA